MYNPLLHRYKPHLHRYNSGDHIVDKQPGGGGGGLRHREMHIVCQTPLLTVTKERISNSKAQVTVMKHHKVSCLKMKGGSRQHVWIPCHLLMTTALIQTMGEQFSQCNKHLPLLQMLQIQSSTHLAMHV
jgi:hypothetical protein